MEEVAVVDTVELEHTVAEVVELADTAEDSSANNHKYHK